MERIHLIFWYHHRCVAPCGCIKHFDLKHRVGLFELETCHHSVLGRLKLRFQFSVNRQHVPDARRFPTTWCYLLPIRRPQKSTPHHAGVRGCNGAGLLDRSEAISFCNAPCESGQKRPLFKSVHTYFRGYWQQSRQVRAMSAVTAFFPTPKSGQYYTDARKARTYLNRAVRFAASPHRGVCAQPKAFGRFSVILTPSLFLITRAAWDCLEVSCVQKTVYRPTKRLCIC
jgi:hypothetical protein